ncbi:hypothetical protein DFH09DRAFT_1191154 [Mycena vulgaris]|nr:hypothetical protein DFH09DRAFT_1191143 [Mycena vulgaris]KAJ6522770.1 hypothetical protein DFH09DRAFT_1191154 [Mycena vulgaris]
MHKVFAIASGLFVPKVAAAVTGRCKSSLFRVERRRMIFKQRLINTVEALLAVTLLNAVVRVKLHLGGGLRRF